MVEEEALWSWTVEDTYELCKILEAACALPDPFPSVLLQPAQDGGLCLRAAGLSSDFSVVLRPFGGFFSDVHGIRRWLPVSVWTHPRKLWQTLREAKHGEGARIEIRPSGLRVVVLHAAGESSVFEPRPTAWPPPPPMDVGGRAPRFATAEAEALREVGATALAVPEASTVDLAVGEDVFFATLGGGVAIGAPAGEQAPPGVPVAVEAFAVFEAVCQALLPHVEAGTCLLSGAGRHVWFHVGNDNYGEAHMDFRALGLR